VLCALLSSPILLWQGPILIAGFFNASGLAAYQNMDIAPAERRKEARDNYKKGLRFNPKSPDIHYNLGLLYEDWNKWDEAAQAYEVAMLEGRTQAYNNLARLYIRQGKANEAINLLLETQESDNYESFILEDLYNFYKNLGWARWQQERYQEAEEALSEALIIAERIKEVKKEIGNPKLFEERVPNLASADCILAQVLHDQGKQTEARQHWQHCLDLGNSQVPEEDEWMGVARQQLNPGRID
jgi:tetratricopeptide (TPR) repeat protein